MRSRAIPTPVIWLRQVGWVVRADRVIHELDNPAGPLSDWPIR